MDEKFLQEMSAGILRMAYRNELITADELQKAESRLKRIKKDKVVQIEDKE